MVMNNRLKLEGEVRIPSGCAIAALISKDGKLTNGKKIIESMIPMHVRSNGLGGGFAAYGIYPEYKDYYAFHLFYDDMHARVACEDFIDRNFDVVHSEIIPTRKNIKIKNPPLIWRYFVKPKQSSLENGLIDADEFVSQAVFQINQSIKGAFVFSSGKNMGVFKGVGYPEDIGEFYRLEEYEGYCWTAHGRYPTNTPGWWGGAHPFNILDYTIIHNGEISSYDANRRSIEMYGYKCTLQTDTEVITYILDYLTRKQGLTLEECAQVIAAPFWDTIDSQPEEIKSQLMFLRQAYPSLLITGPFSIVLGFTGGFMALNDRLKLRSMVVGERDDMVYIASEEAAIFAMDSNVRTIWSPEGGEPVIVKVKEGAY